MLTLYTGTGGGENRKALFDAFVEQVRRGERCLLLVPEQFTVHAEQEVFRLYGRGLAATPKSSASSACATGSCSPPAGPTPAGWNRAAGRYSCTAPFRQ